MIHRVLWVDLSPEAEDALLDTPNTETAKTSVCDGLMRHFETAFLDVPDINALYIADTEIVDTRVRVACAAKPRGYRKATGEVGWAVAILTTEQLTALEQQPETERNAALVEMLKTEKAEQWATHYGSKAQ